MTDDPRPARAADAAPGPQYRTLVIAVAIGSVLATTAPSAAAAAETVTYTYDAKGRLVKVERSGTANNGEKSEYSHDKADNRTQVKRTGATSP